MAFSNPGQSATITSQGIAGGTLPKVVCPPTLIVNNKTCKVATALLPTIVDIAHHEAAVSVDEPIKLNNGTLSISEYLTFDKTQNWVFLAPNRYSFVPGGRAGIYTVAAVAEPQPVSMMGLLSALSLGALFNRKIKRNESRQM